MTIPPHILKLSGVKVQPDRKRSAGPSLIALFIPMKTVSGANVREHHMAKHRRVKKERAIVAAAFAGMDLPPLPATVCMTRRGARLLDTGDNLGVALKHVRDEIAALYGVDDGGADIRWEYAQRVVPRKEVGVGVAIQTDLEVRG